MQDLILKLGIDWKLLLAQVVNFAILAYILQRFVFKPILAALNERQNKIKENIQLGEEIKKKLTEAEEAKAEVLKQARLDGEKIIKEAEKNASKLKEEKLQETRIESLTLISQGRAQIEKDRTTLRAELKKETGELISLAIEKSMGDIINESAQSKLKDQALAVLK
ncbi:MAG: F0F1 ATP synthase subunit B [bacterium]